MRYAPALLILAFLFGCQREFVSNKNARVHLAKKDDHYELIRNGQPFNIKGASGPASLKKLSQIGGNTIRLYDTLGLQNKLDSAEKYQIAVIVDLPIPVSEEDSFYQSESEIRKATAKIGATARRYAKHPALLMWCLGNEPLYYNLTDFDFSSAFNQLLEAVKKADPDHPVGSAVAFIGDRQSINYRLKFPKLDVLLINTFGSLYRVAPQLDRYENFWDIPFIISEYGELGPWEVEMTTWGAPIELNSTNKASRLKFTFREQMPLEHPRFLGSLAFYWGQHQEVTHSWFNFFSDKGEANALYFALADIFGSPIEGNQPPIVQAMEINGSTQFNNFLFEPRQSISASINVQDPDQDSLSIKWVVYPEDWFFKTGERLPEVEVNLKVQADDKKVRFRTPKKPGPYRLFVKISDSQNHFATANLPFYVVQ